MVKVSVIIPVYNAERYLEECLDSITGQTLPDIEIICVNDGSTDRSSGILHRYSGRDGRILLIERENRGYGYTMNEGIARASGEYIGIMEADDYAALNMYEELYQKASEHDLDFVKADFYRFKRAEGGSMELAYNHLSPDPSDYNKIFCPGENPEALRYIMNTWSGIYKRSFLEKYQIRHNETPGASFQDNGFWFQTFINGRRGMIVDRPYYRNRRDNPDSSVKDKGKVYCINAEYDYIRRILLKDPALWERFRHMYWFKKYHNYMGTLWRIDEKYRKEYLLRFSEELKRGIALGDLVKEPFSNHAWNNIRSITEDPEKYYLTRVYPAGMNQKVYTAMQALETENRKLKEEIAAIRRSKTFRLGKLLLFLPGKLKKQLRGRKR